MIKQIQGVGMELCDHDYPKIVFVQFTDAFGFWVLLHQQHTDMQLLNIDITGQVNCPACGYYCYDAKEIS